MKRLLNSLSRRLASPSAPAAPAAAQAQPAQRGPQPPARLFPGIGKHHNIMDVGNFLAAQTSAAFASANFTHARPFPEKTQMYPWAMAQAKGDGLVLEFGVASGGTVNQLADLHKGPVHGFDVFTGLPETWRPGFPKGAFAQDALPKVRKNVDLVVGLFEDTLPGFVAAHPERVKLLHVDCDIYSGTVTIFTELERQIDDDTIIVFDEYLNFPGWERDEHRAFMEFCARTDRVPEFLAFVPASEQVVARAPRRRPDQKVPQIVAEIVPDARPDIPTDGLTLSHVRHVTFDQMEEAGHDIRRFDDGAAPLDLTDAKAYPGLPENWRKPQDLLPTRAAVIKAAQLCADGSVLMPGGSYNYYDGAFHLEPWQQRHVRTTLKYLDADTGEALINARGPREEMPGKAFSLITNAAANYGHFIHDVLSRIHYDEVGAINPAEHKILAPRCRFPMQRALLEKAFDGYQIVELAAGRVYEVEELVWPANFCSSTRFNPAAIATLADRLRTALAPYRDGTSRKVCVSRSDGKGGGGREFVNMDDYEALAEKHGYEVIEVSKLAVEDQFALWANTTDILGVHGAGLMNMIMMPSGSRFTEITGAPHGPAFIARCAVAAGHDVAGFNGHQNSDNQPEIDLKALDKLLKERS
ncbi:glycosyltransferase 61 family protein [Roseovarius atlanticus]|uniref:glycosyltransferase 61 family protein n=1 Tax=Roseovarius atlanticus TaxID=1641875 RepID=UPI0009EA5DE2|nr:glycosyltransferase 61 family protein [Roseovarius atlanticus]